jgi:two-component sensor histidine kinase
LAVDWSCDPESGAVDLSWAERNGPEIETPSHRGFGTRLIERQLCYELGGTSKLEFAPGGLTVKLHVPRLQEKPIP